MASPVNRRKPRLVDRKFQLGLAWRVMIAFFMFFIAWLVIVFAPSMYILATGRSLAELEPAAREFLVLHYRVWPAALLVFAGVFVYTLLLSRRIAGPIYRINAVIKGMIEGEYPEKVSLRSGDYFRDTAELLEQLSRRVSGGQAKTGAGGNGPSGPDVK